MFLARLLNNIKNVPAWYINPLITSTSPVVRNLSTKQETKLVPQNESQNEVTNKINTLIKSESEGRLFAIVHLAGKQFRVTAGDIILVEGYWPPTIGDRIRLDKVLLAAGNDFTLVGRPLLKPGLVNVEATIIEKTLTHTKTNFRKKRRKQYMNINFFRQPNTMIRINTVEIAAPLT